MHIKVLVTGASGQLGKTIEELYSENDLQIDFVFLEKVDLDITNKTRLFNTFTKSNFDFCINCAAYTNVEQAEKTPDIAFKINAEGVKNLAEACKLTNTTLIHISTDYVFDGEKNEPYTPKDKPNPINVYGKSKLKGEQYIQDILEHFYIVRTSWLYSKVYGNNFYRTILKKARLEPKLYITDNQIGCPTNTVNLSEYVVGLIINKNVIGEIVHFCDKKEMTWFDFAEDILLENKLNNSCKLIKSGSYKTFAKRPKFSILN